MIKENVLVITNRREEFFKIENPDLFLDRKYRFSFIEKIDLTVLSLVEENQFIVLDLPILEYFLKTVSFEEKNDFRSVLSHSRRWFFLLANREIYPNEKNPPTKLFNFLNSFRNQNTSGWKPKSEENIVAWADNNFLFQFWKLDKSCFERMLSLIRKRNNTWFHEDVDANGVRFWHINKLQTPNCSNFLANQTESCDEKLKKELQLIFFSEDPLKNAVKQYLQKISEIKDNLYHTQNNNHKQYLQKISEIKDWDFKDFLKDFNLFLEKNGDSKFIVQKNPSSGEYQITTNSKTYQENNKNNQFKQSLTFDLLPEKKPDLYFEVEVKREHFLVICEVKSFYKPKVDEHKGLCQLWETSQILKQLTEESFNSNKKIIFLLIWNFQYHRFPINRESILKLENIELLKCQKYAKFKVTTTVDLYNFFSSPQSIQKFIKKLLNNSEKFIIF